MVILECYQNKELTNLITYFSIILNWVIYSCHCWHVCYPVLLTSL